MSLTGILTFMGLLGFGATISPGVGFFGELILMLPQWVTELSHIPAYGLLTWLLAVTLQQRGWARPYSLLIAVGGATVFGIAMELCQLFVPGRVVSFSDVMMNSIGVATALVLILWQSLSPVGTETQPRALCCSQAGKE